MPSLAADRVMTREDYAIYSSVLASIRLSHADRGEALAIARDTINPHEFPFPHSNIFFNAKKTVALVYVSATCGLLCMSTQWYLVEKIKRVWRVLPIPGCGAIS